MTISRVELQGQITRAQDFTAIKHQEDSRGFVEQANIHQKTEQKVEVKARQVQHGDKAENEGKRFDAKDSGNGHYYGDGGKKRKKQEEKKNPQKRKKIRLCTQRSLTKIWRNRSRRS